MLRFRRDAAAAAYRVPIDLENIEELFNLASASDQRITESVKLSIAATLAYCLDHATEPNLEFHARDPKAVDMLRLSNGDDRRGNVLLYDAIVVKLLNGLEPSKASIVSFNYDDLIERSLVRIGNKYHYGLKRPHDVDNNANYSSDGVAVLKLHGSVNWAYPRERGRKFTIFKDYESVRSNGLVPEIVPPTWNKAIADRLAEVWFEAIDKLTTATKVVVIGFSIPRTDMHFKYLLAAGMKDNLSLREIVFVDPSESLPERVREVLASREIDNGRVRFVNKRLSDLLGDEIRESPGRYEYAGHAIPF